MKEYFKGKKEQKKYFKANDAKHSGGRLACFSFDCQIVKETVGFVSAWFVGPLLLLAAAFLSLSD